MVLSLLAILAAIALCYFFLPPPRGPKGQVAEHERGSLHTVNGMKILCLQGSSYAMGYEYGRLLQKEIQDFHREFNRFLEGMAKETLHVSPWVARRVLDVVYRCSGPYIHPRYRRELEGVADGSGVSLQELRRVHVISVITERACSSFAVFGKATADGKVYHSRNFDWALEVGLQNHPILVVYKGENKLPFVNIGYVGWIGCLSGMNLEGISMGHIGAISDDKSLFGTPMPFLIRQVLEDAGDLDEAARIIAQAQRTVGNNYVIADGQARKAVALETCRSLCALFADNDPKEASVEYAIPIEDAVFRADEAMDPRVRSHQRCANSYPNLPYGSNSYDHRYLGMAKRIQDHYGRIDSETAIQIVRDTAMRECNLHWVLYAPCDLDFWVAHAKGMDDAWQQPALQFNLRELLHLFLIAEDEI